LSTLWTSEELGIISAAYYVLGFRILVEETMGDTWPRIIRDPLHGLVTFEDTECDRLLLRLINTKEFQRLRRIKQLGMSEFVFPGANHTRFAHSIGVVSFARKFLTRLHRLSGNKLTDEHRIVVLTASLLHDLGHGPFSHTFEKITGEDHEARTLEIILSGDTEVNKYLREFDPALPEGLAVFFDEDVGTNSQSSESNDLDHSSDNPKKKSWRIPDYLTQVVTSQLDADRFDYLLRDSYATGTNYGNFDADWLIEHLFVDESKGRFYLNHKGLHAAESYVYARHHMYQTVYFHKTTRAGEVMLRQVFRRYKERLSLAETMEQRRTVVSEAPEKVLKAFSGQMSLEQYLLLDDLTVWEFLKAASVCDDSILSDLSSGLVHRKLLKTVDFSGLEPDALLRLVDEFKPKAEKAVRDAGYDPQFYLSVDTPADTPYKQYNPDAENPAKEIYVQSQGGAIKELSTCSESVKVLMRRVALIRYYFPDTTRKGIQQSLPKALGGKS
jgi:HD superfamily phosphohydrolase